MREKTFLLPTSMGHRTNRKEVLALLGFCFAVALVTLTFSFSLSAPRELVQTLEDEQREAAHIEKENQLLEQEESFLLRLAKSQSTMDLSAVSSNSNNGENLDSKNLIRSMKSAQLQQQLMIERIMGNRGFQSRSSTSALSMKRLHKLQQLVGSYVKVCSPWGCKMTYKPEEGDLNMTWYAGHNANKSVSWAGSGNTGLDVSSRMFSPFGPVTRMNITRYQVPRHDIIPRASKLGDNWVGFGHGDAFVKVEDSGLGVYPQLPPWKQQPLKGFNNYNYTFKPFPLFSAFKPGSSDVSALEEANATIIRCPADPEGKSKGKLCLSGNGIDGVYESSIISPVFYDPNKGLMEEHGVTVDSWPWLFDPKHHDWGRDAKDHFAPGQNPQAFDYDTAKRPFWAYDNHAMRSLPEYQDPEGPANKKLMLGALWNSSHGPLPSLDDDWIGNTSYSLQLEPKHGETVEDDHFADWKHASPENIRLLYGESNVFNGLRHKKNSTETEPDPWSLGDVPLNETQFADLVGFDPAYARSGEPIRDLQLGWQGQNLVASSAYNLQSVPAAAEPFGGFAPSAGRLALEKEGVNVGGAWFD